MVKSLSNIKINNSISKANIRVGTIYMYVCMYTYVCYLILLLLLEYFTQKALTIFENLINLNGMVFSIY